MFRLAHISDIHLSPLPRIRYRELASKRITGYINWLRNRKNAMHGTVLDSLIADMLAQNPDHIAVTGDLVNLALNLEIDIAHDWLAGLGNPDDVSVVPGNHDAYVPGALDRSCRKWEPWMRGDGIDNHNERPVFPYMRARGPVAMIGVSSARATAPFMASGDFRSAQAKRLAKLLDEAGSQGLFRVVMIHHPPIHGATPTHKRLYGIRRFQKVIRQHGAELVIHGHTHLATRYDIDGPNGNKVPVVCVPSASQNFGGHKPPARYNIFNIDRKPEGGWLCLWEQHGIEDASERIIKISEQKLY
ncbi:metallophosphoesterase [Brucella pituitosa]|uniref:metallophosphoesterase family protein n=1 Tax=Brucella TaxID=234 RepID=UPI000462FD75|nr:MULTISPECIES: metallophosphoesterase [Brucella]PQZ51404.1 metallophosphatase [Ochrobactrum sp. MYb19]PRA56072.1 metallophosphatase [Ochrobactrum sp. MYb68]PRA65562.1 metallophosphatase [Ochrobactrum sp. MYb18]PRA77252.1 metallophosphatase [Brucella thiophenivorans]PRA87819.1 metallophosphatase [Ochrobactrum sp. MYb29]PRA93113.1 metallophosphatase [Ochrobactrum sp. MYb14]PRA99262.1 metallophosphatase [Ochrobactrum sp. MYb15]